MESWSYVTCLLIFALFIGTDTTIRLIKKKTHDGLKFSRTIKYTNESIPGMKKSVHSNKTQELSIDILMVADFSTYQAFMEMSNSDSTAAQHYLNMYLSAIFDQTKILYDNIKFGNETLKLNYAGSFIAFREEDCPLWLSWEEEEMKNNMEVIDIYVNDTDINNSTDYDNSTDIDVITKMHHFVDTTLDELQEANSTEMTLRIDSKLAIDKFIKWIKQYSSHLPKHEHAVLITKFDLISINGHSATQGMAYLGCVCELGDSSSVVEDIGGSLTALIAAHEIGHSLGAVHDGADEAYNCSSNDNYLMASSVSGSSERETYLNSRRMSECSVNSIIENFKQLSASCVKKWKTVNKNTSQIHQDLVKKPGETITLMQQCQIAFGPTFGSCLNNGYYYGNSHCSRVWCMDRKDPDGDLCQTLNYFPAFDGTECGYHKWCIAGECVPNPKKAMDCKDLNVKTCSKYSASKLKHFCKSDSFREICCRTCAKKGKII